MLSLTWLKLTSTPLALGSAIQGLQVARVAALASEGTKTDTARAMRAIFTSLSIRASLCAANDDVLNPAVQRRVWELTLPSEAFARGPSPRTRICSWHWRVCFKRPADTSDSYEPWTFVVLPQPNWGLPNSFVRASCDSEYRGDVSRRNISLGRTLVPSPKSDLRKQPFACRRGEILLMERSQETTDRSYCPSNPVEVNLCAS